MNQLEKTLNTRDGKFTARDGLSLYWKAWLPDGTPKAVIHLICGYAEHIGRYQNVVNELVPAGYAIFGKDHRGHGKSEGKRGHVGSFQEYIDDERQFALEVIRPSFPDTPCFMHGHSMGSIIAINYAVLHQDHLKGLVLSGTGSLPGKGIPKAIMVVTKILSRILPGMHVKSPLPPEFISRDPDVVRAYVNDPLVYNVITPRLAEQMQTYLLIGASNAQRISLPVLIQNGSADTSFSGQQELLDGIAAPDKTFKLYEGLRHEVYNELPGDRARVLSDLHAWLDSHLNM
jgi:alpha-beta hydrolase superfamily lysophospholipase